MLVYIEIQSKSSDWSTRIIANPRVRPHWEIIYHYYDCYAIIIIILINNYCLIDECSPLLCPQRSTLIDNYYPTTIIGHCYALNDYSRIDDCWLLLHPQRLLPPSTITPTVHRRLLAPSTIAGSIDDSCALHDYGSYRQLLPH